MRSLRPEIRYPSRPAAPSPLRPRAPSGLAVLLAGLLAAALLAGCTAGGGDSNKAPHADLSVDKDNGWTGEEFRFDASESKDPDGKITEYKFDFGDGSPPMTVKTEDEANSVSHVYAKGGQYTVTLIVTDDGKDNTGVLTDNEAQNLVVNEKVKIASMALDTLGDADVNGTVPFDVHEKANRFDMNVTLRSSLVTGSSEFNVKVVDPDNNTIAEKTEAVGPGTTGQVVNLDGILTKQGAHRVVIEAKSGGGTAEGELRIIYGEDLPG